MNINNKIDHSKAVTVRVSRKLDTVDELSIEVSDTQEHVPIETEILRSWAKRVLLGERRSVGRVSIAIVGNAAIHEINRRYLKHNYPTDVITFLLSDEGARFFEGQVILSGEMAAAIAPTMGVSPRCELALYLVHGLLHLCGHDDKSERDAAAMRERENHYLQLIGPNELINKPAWGRSPLLAQGEVPCPR